MAAALLALIGIALGFQAWREELLRDARREGLRQLQGVAQVLDSPKESINAGLNEVADLAVRVTAGRASVASVEEHLRHVQLLTPAVRTAVIFDVEGTVVASSRPELVGRNFRDRQYFKQAVYPGNFGMTLISEPYLGALGVWVVNATRVVHDERLRPVGVASLTLSPEFLNLALDLGSASDREYRALLHPSGKVMADFDPSGRMRDRLWTGDRTIDFRDAAPPASRLGGAGSATSAERITDGPNAALIQTLWLPWGSAGTGQGWVMMSVRPLDEMLGPWRAGLGIALLSFLIVFGGAAAAMQFAAARSVRRLRRLEQAREAHQLRMLMAQRQSSRLAVTASVAQLAGWTVEWPARTVKWSDEMIQLYALGQPAPDTLAEMCRMHTPVRLNTLQDELECCLREQGRFDEDFCCEVPTGTRRWFRLAGGPAVDVGDGIWVIECVAMDITHRVVSQRVADEQRQRFEEALRQSRHLEAIGTLAGGVAHDFNNLLGITLVNAREIQSLLPADHPAQSALNHIIESGLIGRSHVERIQAVAANRSALRESVDGRQLLSRTADLLRATVPARIRVQVQTPAPAVWLTVDVRQLQQVILNLASNALHAMPEPAAGQLQLTLTVSTAGVAMLSCIDSGVGMSEDVRRRALEPFFTTRAPGQGVGLGLSMANAFAKDHGGRIEIDSTPGQGTTVRLCLPLAPAPAPADSMEGPGSLPAVLSTPSTTATHLSTEDGAERTSWPPLRTAVVDDNRLMRVAVERQIRRLGHEVVLYGSGPELIGAIERQDVRFDVVLTDFNLPEMSGLEIIQTLKTRWPALQVILYSGYVADDVRQRALELGAQAVLRKEDTAVQLPEILGVLQRRTAEAVVSGVD